MDELIIGIDEGVIGGDMTAVAMLCRNCNGLFGVQLVSPGEPLRSETPVECPYCHTVFKGLRVIKED